MTVQEPLDGSGTQPFQSSWLVEYSLSSCADIGPQTRDSYFRALRQIVEWIAAQPETAGPFHPVYLKPHTVEIYIQKLLEEGRSLPHARRVRRAIKGFSLWLITRGELISDPTEGFALPPSKKDERVPHRLTQEQRKLFLSLVETSGDLRGKAIFALVYWVGCRASEISHLLKVNTVIEDEKAHVVLGGPENRSRTIPIHEIVRISLMSYLEQGERQHTSAYTFTSQREAIPVPAGDLDGWRLGTRAIHSWFRNLKNSVEGDKHEQIVNITLSDLRYDFKIRSQAVD